MRLQQGASPRVIDLISNASLPPPEVVAIRGKKNVQNGTMKLSATDVRIDHLYLGPGKGGRLVVTHLPSGLYVTEDIPMTKSALSIQRRLMSALKMKILEEGKN
jgi:hypothetical protein